MKRSAHARATHVDFAMLERIQDLELRARIMVESFLSGVHASPRYGHNAEFASYREYRRGDEPRHIDWRVWGRTDHFYLKLFNADCNLTTWLAVDVSGSMSAGGNGSLKRRMSTTLAAGLGLLMMRQHDTFGFLAFADEVRDELAPGSGLTHFSHLLRRLDSLRHGGPTAFPPLFQRLEHRLRRRSMVILISDCTGPPEEIEDGMKRLRFYGHELIILRPLSQEETEFPYARRVILVDAETGERRLVDGARARAAYHENLEAHTQRLQHLGRRNQVDVETFTVRDLSVKPLALYLARRERLR